MSEDQKMFQIGAWALGIVFVLMIGLQVGYRTQRRSISRVANDIVKTQQEIAIAQANFASFVRPEVLRNSVLMIAPKSETVSFHKSVLVSQLPDKKLDE